MNLLEELGTKAARLGVPFSVHLDITYRCNERCVHCYLDHDDHGEMNTAEIKKLLGEMAEAGVFMLTLSGGEIMLRRDFFEILERAHELGFLIKLKTNAILIGEGEAERMRELGVEAVQVSIYSHRPEVHDAITKVPGSLKKSLKAIGVLKAKGLTITIANVLMKETAQDYRGVQALAEELGVLAQLDPTVTPMMDGDRSVLALNANLDTVREVFRDQGEFVEEFCGVPGGATEDTLDSAPCSAGHTACYVSPYGDVYPCVQFPLPSGNVRRTKFVDIWKHSEQLNEVRSITLRDLPSCSQCVHVGSCTRCPGLAYLEGSMRGPSIQDCEKSFARTGVPSVNLVAKQEAARAGGAGFGGRAAGLVQIQGLAPVGAGQAPAA
jgi:radical SAM protein with 4Fe4S-binding SPASM domain